MNARWTFALIGAAAVLAGSALWLATRASTPALADAQIAPGALMAASFTDENGASASLARFPRKVLVVNFWATWCAPCREEMPALSRIQTEWGPRGVQVVGLSAEDAETVRAFAARSPVQYPLWVGGDEVSNLSRRLGNQMGVLPFTALVGPDGVITDRKVGPYTAEQLVQRLRELTAKSIKK